MDLLLLLARVGAPVPDAGGPPMPDAGDPPTLTGPCPNPFTFFFLLCNKKVPFKATLSCFLVLLSLVKINHRVWESTLSLLGVVF